MLRLGVDLLWMLLFAHDEVCEALDLYEDTGHMAQ